MFRRLISETRRSLAEAITAPPQPSVGAGRKPAGKPAAIKPAFIPPPIRSASYMKNQPKIMGAGKPAKASNNAAGMHKTMASGNVSKAITGKKGTFSKHKTVQGTIGGKPTGGSAGGPGTPATSGSGSGMKMNGLGKGRENS